MKANPLMNSFRKAALCIALLGITATSSQAQASKTKTVSRPPSTPVYGGRGSASGIEKSLLGVRMLQSYKTVFAKYGAPTRIYRLGEVLDFTYDYDANGKPTGGILGFADSAASTPGGGSGGSGGSSSRGGYGNGSGRSGGPPPGYGGGNGGAQQPYGGYGSGGRGGASSGREEGGGPSGGPSPSGGSPSPGGGGGGLNAVSGNGEDVTFKASGGYVWAYLYPDRRCNVFLFNASGRCEVILELGRFGGGPTSRGLKLGSPLQSVYQNYGWPDSVKSTPIGMSLYYNNKYHLQVEVLNNKVTGLLVCLSEEQKYTHAGGDSGGGGGRSGAPGGGGRSGSTGGGGGSNRRSGGGGATSSSD